ncbi:MAG: hypothetical protein Q3959_00215 [Limosilactobacillus sp.]|uniref:hypothetical protein n=1 Tax=Limosilactobacillus sp. TaxID=2773925 RepID=UPI0026F660B5|nr:hypothetical protein [Limosilactobacillus sp.]
MDKKQLSLGSAFAIGLFMVAGFSIDSHGFHSGIYGIIGCVLLLGSYLGLYWDKIKSGDLRIKRLSYLLGGLLLLVVILDVIEMII